MLTDFYWDEAKMFLFFLKKKIKMADSKKLPKDMQHSAVYSGFCSIKMNKNYTEDQT